MDRVFDVKLCLLPGVMAHATKGVMYLAHPDIHPQTSTIENGNIKIEPVKFVQPGTGG